MRLCILLMGAIQVNAATYYVSSSGNDGNIGNQLSPWLTVGKATSTAAAGDTVHIVGPTVYAEVVTVAHSGSSGSPIIFKGDNYPTVQGQIICAQPYVQFVGINIRQTVNNGALLITGASNVMVSDCTFSNTAGVAIRAAFGGVGNGNVIRSNIFDEIGVVGAQTSGSDAIQIYGTNNLVEYNVFGRTADRINMAGSKNIIRNNYMGMVTTNDISPDPHIDLFQLDDPPTGVSYSMFERNYSVSNWLGNSHGGIWSSTAPYKTNNGFFIYRMNTVDHVGSYAVICTFFRDFKFYNNTWVYARSYLASSDGFVDFDTSSTNCFSYNNVFYNCNSNLSHVYIQDATILPTLTNDYDLNFQSGTIVPAETHQVLGDPLFVSTSDFHLQATSPGIGKSGPQSFATASGTSTNVVPIFDAGRFCDGYGISGVLGDSIIVSGTAAATVTNIDYVNNLLYFAANLTWTNNAPITLDNTQDIGAYLYRAGGYIYSVAITSPVNGQGVPAGATTITTTVTNPSVVRFVRFYVDGLEIGFANSAPYNQAWTSDGLPHTIEARAYALYADPVLAVKASVSTQAGNTATLSGNITISGNVTLH